MLVFKKRLWSPQMFLRSTFRSYSDAKIWVVWKNYFLLLCEYCYWNWKCLWAVFREGVQGDGSCKCRVDNGSSSQAKYEYLNLNSFESGAELSRECDSANHSAELRTVAKLYLFSNVFCNCPLFNKGTSVCVCECVCVYISLWGPNIGHLLYLWGPNALMGTQFRSPQVWRYFETKNVVLVTGLQFGYSVCVCVCLFCSPSVSFHSTVAMAVVTQFDLRRSRRCLAAY